MSLMSSSGSTPWLNRFMRQRDEVDVAGALAVAEQAALDPVGAGQHAELGRRHRAAAVVVRVQRQHDGVAVAHGAQEPLDGVGVDVRRVHLDRGRQVHDQRLVGRRLDDVGDRVADLDRVLDLGAGVALGRVLVAHVGAGHRPSSLRHSRAALTAMSVMPALSRPNTTRRCRIDVEL